MTAQLISAPFISGYSSEASQATSKSNSSGYGGDADDSSLRTILKKRDAPIMLETNWIGHYDFPTSKRQRIMEEAYNASNVRKDMSRGGLAFPRICKASSLCSSKDYVNTDTVCHLYANNCTESPFLTCLKPSSILRTDETWNVSMAALAEISRYHYYEPIKSTVDYEEAIAAEPFESYSSTSSMTDNSEEGDSQEIHNKQVGLRNIGEALSISNTPR
jgi:hypothetical protein